MCIRDRFSAFRNLKKLTSRTSQVIVVMSLKVVQISFLGPLIKSYSYGFMSFDISLIAVSYTHLDVYKRQGIIHL